MAAVISGIQTAPSLTHHIVIRVSETLILSIFTIECALPVALPVALPAIINATRLCNAALLSC